LYFGEKNCNARMTRRAAIQVHAMKHKGYLIREIAEEFDVSYYTIRSILRGRTWAEVKEAYDKIVASKSSE
jgi:transposase